MPVIEFETATWRHSTHGVTLLAAFLRALRFAGPLGVALAGGVAILCAAIVDE